MKVEDLARRIDVNPHWCEKELETVKERYLWKVQWQNAQLTGKEQQEEWADLHKAAKRLDSLISGSKHPFMEPTLQNHWEPACTTEDLINMLRGIQKLTKGNAGKMKPSNRRRNKRYPGYLLSLLCEAWENLAGKPADTSARFQDFMHFSCDYMGLDSSGLWERHRKRHAQRQP